LASTQLPTPLPGGQIGSIRVEGRRFAFKEPILKAGRNT
jgi:hypothetical protein